MYKGNTLYEYQKQYGGLEYVMLYCFCLYYPFINGWLIVSAVNLLGWWVSFMPAIVFIVESTTSVILGCTHNYLILKSIPGNYLLLPCLLLFLV